MAKNCTYIENNVMENLISSGLNGTELSVTLLLIRKTNGWNKEMDEISLNQFLKYIPVTKPTLCKAIKNLQLVKIIKLVKKGKSLKCSNKYMLEKNIENWQLVKKTKLVKVLKRTSKDIETKLVKKPLHTKNTITKNTIQNKVLSPIQEIVEKYKDVKNFNTIKNWDKHHFARASKSAKAILEQAGDVKQSFLCIEEVGKYCAGEGLSWTIETVVKKFPDWKLGQLKPKIQQPKDNKPDYLLNRLERK